MRITDVESIVLRLPEVREIGDGCQSILLVRIHTDEGVTGIGEVHTNPPAAKAILDAPLLSVSASGMKRLLVGENPLDINALWDRLYHKTQTYGRRGLAMHVLSGIDIALWDLLGKVVGQPVYRLLGGARRHETPVYASDLDPGDPAAMVELAQKHVGNGYRAMKFGWGGLGRDVRRTVRTIERIRAAIGPEPDIMVDLGFAAPLEDAVYLGRGLAEPGVYFLEEPLAPDDLHGFARLTAVSPTPIATGEKETTLYPYLDLMERGGLRIIQPDVARVGGISETLRIAAHAEARGVRVIPHCWSTDILVAATLHVIATLRDCPYLEYNVTDNPLRTDLLVEPLRPVEGIIRVPDKPGLGIELDEDVVARYRVEA
jgi:L-alanine-DL-glutamate epimerase-like enolase superfamily enzyme